MNWVVYILKCNDGSFYTGITNDLERRFKEHSDGKGAKYTRGRSPLKVVYTEGVGDKGEALRRELKIKSLKRGEKEKLISLTN